MNRFTTASKQLGALAAALLLAACSSGPQGIRFTNEGTTSSSKPVAQPIRNLSAAEINSAISGKTFQYTRADGNGFITYAANGTFEFQDDVKGPGTGAWSTNGGQFCESFSGGPMVCGDFKNTGDAYFAAKSRLVEMKS